MFGCVTNNLLVIKLNSVSALSTNPNWTEESRTVNLYNTSSSEPNNRKSILIQS